jgi:hypothetical protein
MQVISNMISTSNAESNFADDAEELNGGVAPFGECLSVWMSNAPGFLMKKINTPLLVESDGQSSVALTIWLSITSAATAQQPGFIGMRRTRTRIRGAARAILCRMKWFAGMRSATTSCF